MTTTYILEGLVNEVLRREQIRNYTIALLNQGCMYPIEYLSDIIYQEINSHYNNLLENHKRNKQYGIYIYSIILMQHTYNNNEEEVIEALIEKYIFNVLSELAE